MEHVPFKRCDDEAATAIAQDALEASSYAWPCCPACNADALVGTVDGVTEIGRPLTAEESAGFGLRCEACEHVTEGFPVFAFCWRQ